MELNEDASNVSQGQKQLLTIARAILADNQILILDEATSFCRYQNRGTEIQKAMDNLMKGQNKFCHCTQIVYDPGCRSDPCYERRRYYRTGQS